MTVNERNRITTKRASFQNRLSLFETLLPCQNSLDSDDFFLGFLNDKPDLLLLYLIEIAPLPYGTEIGATL